MKTEEQARACWCPFARVGMGTATGVNRIRMETEKLTAGMVEARARCIASECMAWAWDQTTRLGYLQDRAASRKGEPALGYCGLVGKS